MRPLRPPFHDSEVPPFAEADAVAAVIDQVGAYCSICERPLFERAFVWDPQQRASPRYGKVAPPQALALCVTCDEAQAAREDGETMLTLPFESTTFSLGTARQFSYDPDGSVRAETPLASRTLEYFDLGYRRGDPRTELRIRTWAVATSSLDFLETALERTLLANLMILTGYLSVWATALLARFDPPAASDFLARASERPGFFAGTDWPRFLDWT